MAHDRVAALAVAAGTASTSELEASGPGGLLPRGRTRTGLRGVANNQVHGADGHPWRWPSTTEERPRRWRRYLRTGERPDREGARDRGAAPSMARVALERALTSRQP